MSCNHATSHDVTYDPVTSGENKAQFARRLQHFKELESNGGDLRIDVSEPQTPRDELLDGIVSELNDMFRPNAEAPSVNQRSPSAADNMSSLSSPRTPDSAGRNSATYTSSSATYASSISESLETSLRSINELADEWGCRGEEPLRPGVPAPSRRRFPSQECMANRPLNGHVTFSEDVGLHHRPRVNTASAADGVEMRRISGTAYTANRHKRFSDDVTMFCYHNEAKREPPVRNAMSVSPVGTYRHDADDTGSSSDESRALDELLAELTGTSFRKQERRTNGARNRSAGSRANTNANGIMVGARFKGSADNTNVQRQVSGGQKSSNMHAMSSPRSTATTPPIVHATHSGCEQRHLCYPAAPVCNNVGPVDKRPVMLSHVAGQGRRSITFEDDENDELREIASLSRTISSGCSNDILVEIVTNALKRSVTREYSATRSDSPEADIDKVLEHADTEIFTGDVTLRRVFSVQRERDDGCESHSRRSPFSRLSTPDQDTVDSGASCEHCGFTYGSKRVCENEASHTDVVVQQKWMIKDNVVAARRDPQATSPPAITSQEYVRTRQDIDLVPHTPPVQDWKLETVHVEPAIAQQTNDSGSNQVRTVSTPVLEQSPDSGSMHVRTVPTPVLEQSPDSGSMHVRTVHTHVLEPSLESAFEEALEGVTDADSSFHEDTPADKPRDRPAAPVDVDDHLLDDLMKPARSIPTSSCECIADDRSSRSVNDLDTDTSAAQSAGDTTTEDSDPEWADYKGGKRSSFGQLIGDTLRMTEEILATFDHMSCDDDDDVGGGVDPMSGDDKQAKSVVVSPSDPVTSVQAVNGSATTTESEDREYHEEPALEATRVEGHQELSREVFVANTMADSEECFFPYLEVIPPNSPKIQKAPCIVEPAPPIEEPTKREAIFSELIVSRTDTDSDVVEGEAETRSRGATPDVDRLFVQAAREVAYDSSSDMLSDLCMTTDEEPDLDALVESNTTPGVVCRTPTEQERSAITRDRAPEVGSAVDGNDTDKHSPNAKKKRKYVGARKRVDVTQFTQFRPTDHVDRSADEKSVRFEAQDADRANGEKEHFLTPDSNEHTVPPPDSQIKTVDLNDQQETVGDDVNRHVGDNTQNVEVISAAVDECFVERRDDEGRDAEGRDAEGRDAEGRDAEGRDLETVVFAPGETDTNERPDSIQHPEDDMTTDNAWRTVLCEESSDLADTACHQLQTASPSGARYVYRASSTRGNTERFDEMKRRTSFNSAVAAVGETDASGEKVVSEELDIKKVTLLFTLPKEIAPVLPRRPPGAPRGKKRIHIRRVTRIKADGTVEVIQAPTVQTIHYAPGDTAAITTATVAPSGEQTTPQCAHPVGAAHSATDADGTLLAQNTHRKADAVPIDINMKYRHTKLRKYCKVAPLQQCAVGPPSATSLVTSSGDQNGKPDDARQRAKETTQERCGAEECPTTKNSGKVVNGTDDNRDTRLNGEEHKVECASKCGVHDMTTNGVEEDIKATNSDESHAVTTNAACSQWSTTESTTQNGGVPKAKQPPKVKPKPKIPLWLVTELSTEPVNGDNQVCDVNDTVTEPAAGSAMHRDTTSAPPVMRSFKETTL